MAPEPDDRLERLFAEDEAAITEDGFSKRVMEQAKGPSLRRTAIYGAGVAGAGFALGGILELAPHLRLDQWLVSTTSAVSGAIQNANLSGSVQNASDATLLGLVAIIAGVTFLVAAVAQAR